MPFNQQTVLVHYQPERPQNYEQPKLRLSVKLWQIFTGITIVLTIASLLIYFSDLVPNNQEGEFVRISKIKSTLYNHSERLSSWFDKNKYQGLVGYQIKEPCYKDIQSVNVNQEFFQNTKDLLGEYRRFTDSLMKENDYDEATTVGGKFDDYFHSVEGYQTRVNVYFERQELYSESILQIQKDAAELCESDIDNINTVLANFGQSLEGFPLSSLPSYETWISSVKEWKKITQTLITSIQDGTFDRALSAEAIQAFVKGYINIFSISFNSESEINQVTESRKVMNEKLAQFEDWEKKSTLDKPELQKLLVPIVTTQQE